MKKKLQFLLTMILSLHCAGFIHAQNALFHVRFSTSAASCYNNGKIVYSLTDSGGTILDSLPEGMSQVRIYYRLTPTDTIHYSGWYYTGGSDTLTIDCGNYIVGVEGLMSDGHGGYMRVDTEMVITVETTYSKPEASALPQMATSMNGAGNIPTVLCENGGRVQLLITGGSFPYTVTVCDHSTGDTLRTQIFSDYQHQDSLPNSATYKYYYSFDTMPAGIWDFYVVDGCGYGLPRITQSVSSVTLPKVNSICNFASSGNFSDTNMVRIQLFFDKNVDLYEKYLARYAKYRFVYEGLETKEWKPLILPENNVNIYLYDTVFSAEKYCDIWDRKITFEYKLEECEEWQNSISFYYYKPNADYFEKDTFNTFISVKDSVGECGKIFDWKRDYYSIRYYSLIEENKAYDPESIKCGQDPISLCFRYHRYYYTHPLTWVYTDMRTGNVIKKDTISIITDFSYLNIKDVEAIYGSLEDSAFSIPVQRQLLDRKGCLLYVTADTMSFFRSQSRFVREWEVSKNNNQSHCCADLDIITVSEVRSSVFVEPTPVTIRLVQSPDNNRYNFEAVYDPETETWTITRARVDNTAIIEGRYNGKSLAIKDYCMLTGPYRFEVDMPCDTLFLLIEASFRPVSKMELVEEPAYTITRDCGNMYITYTAGRYVSTYINRHYWEDVADTGSSEYVPTISMIKAPHNSSNIKKGFGLNTPILVSMPGEYVFEFCPDKNFASSYCELTCLRDTFELGIRTVEFEYAKALLCDSSFTTGNAYVKANNGSEPYTYTLYSRPDRQGEVLGSNHTGVFLNVPMRPDQELSCLVTDSCLSYFHVNFYPRTLADLKKVWFDDGMTVSSACEGTTIQVHALSISDVLSYEWSGPGGFQATTAEPFVNVPDFGVDGWYKVTITYDQCGQALTDSIYLTVSELPSVSVVLDTTVCPGDTVAVQFVPESPLEAAMVNFTIAFHNGNGITTKNYSSVSGDTVTDYFVTFTDAKLYPILVDDGRCGRSAMATVDTAYIQMRTDILSACNILTTNDMVCYGGDAHLTAKSTLEPPYTLKWYADYDLAKLLKVDDIQDTDRWSFYDTAAITQRTMLYVALEAEGYCPTVNGLTTNEMNMQDGTTVVHCGQAIRLYDAGGADHNYPVRNTAEHHFRSADGRPLLIHFDRIELSQTAHLMIFTGNEPKSDSLLWELTEGSWKPGVLMSAGDALTLLFTSGNIADEGWSAVVECAPGVAVADVWPSREIVLRDEVCQSQTLAYDDPYGIAPEIAGTEELNQAMRKSGHYYFSKTYQGVGDYGCDSTVTFELTVNPPVTQDTTVLTTIYHGGSFLWHDTLYTQSGHYAKLYDRPDGCDTLEVLHLMIVDAEIQSENVCKGETAYMEVEVHSQNNVVIDKAIRTEVHVGDVLCLDGSILSVDSFLLSGKSAKGVIFFVDQTGNHGLAVALSEALLPFAQILTAASVEMIESMSDAISNMSGVLNTRRIKNAVDIFPNATFDTHAPAVKYCYYFDPHTLHPLTSNTGWYMPSVGEMNLLYSRRLDVNNTLRKMAGQRDDIVLLSNSNYWTSTIFDQNNAWIITDSGGFDYLPIHNICKSRPIIAF